MRTLFRLFALLNIANGLWMLLAPESWHHHLPAGVPDTGPFNITSCKTLGPPT